MESATTAKSSRSASAVARLRDWFRASGTVANLDRRDLPSNFKEPAQWLIDVFGGPTASGRNVGPETATNISTVYRCVQVIAGNLATLPLKLYQRTASGREERADHPVSVLIKGEPNDWDTSLEFRFLMQGLVCLRGNAFARIFRHPDRTVEAIEPMEPGAVEVRGHRRPDGRRVISYWLRGGLLNPADILHVKGFPSPAGYVGYSPVTLMRETLGVSLATEDHAARFFANDSTPNGALKTEVKLDDAQVAAFSSQWNARQGGANKGKTAILHGGLDWKQIGMSNEDSQFLETRRFQVEEICRWFGVPPHLAGSNEKSTSWGSGLEEQKSNFVTFTMLVWLTNWERSLTRSLLTEQEKKEGYYFKFNLEAFLRGKSTEQMTTLVKGLTNGVYTINEVRSKLEENEIADGIGGVHRVPLNTAPATADSLNQPTQDDQS